MTDFSLDQLREEALNEWLSLGFDASTFSLEKLTKTWLIQDHKSIDATEGEELFKAKQELLREYHAGSTPFRDLSKIGKAIAKRITSRIEGTTGAFLSNPKLQVRQHAIDARKMSQDSTRYQSHKFSIHAGFRQEKVNDGFKQNHTCSKHMETLKTRGQKRSKTASAENDVQQLPSIEPRQETLKPIGQDHCVQKVFEEELLRRELNERFWKQKNNEGKVRAVSIKRSKGMIRSNSGQSSTRFSLITDENLSIIKKYLEGTFSRSCSDDIEKSKLEILRKMKASDVTSLREKIDDLKDIQGSSATEHETIARLIETQVVQLENIGLKQQIIQSSIKGPPRRDPTKKEKIELHELALQKKNCANQIATLEARRAKLQIRIECYEQSRSDLTEELNRLLQDKSYHGRNKKTNTSCELPGIADRPVDTCQPIGDMHSEEDYKSRTLTLDNTKNISKTQQNYTSVTRNTRLRLLEQRLDPIYRATESLKNIAAQRWCLQIMEDSQHEEIRLLKSQVDENQAKQPETRRTSRRSECCDEIKQFHRAKTLRNASHAIADSLKLWEHCAGIHISNFRYLEPLQIITLEQDDLEGFLCGSFELPRCLTYRFELHVEQLPIPRISSKVSYQNLNYDLKIFAGPCMKDLHGVDCGVHLFQEGRIHRHSFQFYGKAMFFRIEMKNVWTSLSDTRNSVNDPLPQFRSEWLPAIQNSVHYKEYTEKVYPQRATNIPNVDHFVSNFVEPLRVERELCGGSDRYNILLENRIKARRKLDQSRWDTTEYKHHANAKEIVETEQSITAARPKTETVPTVKVVLHGGRSPSRSRDISAKRTYSEKESPSFSRCEEGMDFFDMPVLQVEMKGHNESSDSVHKEGDEICILSGSLSKCASASIPSQPQNYSDENPLSKEGFLLEESDGKHPLKAVKESFNIMQRDNSIKQERDTSEKDRLDELLTNAHAKQDRERALKNLNREGYRDLTYNKNIFVKEVMKRSMHVRDEKTLHHHKIGDRDRQEVKYKRGTEMMALRSKNLVKKEDIMKALQRRERLMNVGKLEMRIEKSTLLTKKLEFAAPEVDPTTLLTFTDARQGSTDLNPYQERIVIPQIDVRSLLEGPNCDGIIATNVYDKEFGEMELTESHFYDNTRQRCIDKLHARHNLKDSVDQAVVHRSSLLYQRLVEERHRVAFHDMIQFYSRLRHFQIRIQQLTDEIAYRYLEQGIMKEENVELEGMLAVIKSRVRTYEREYYQAYSLVVELDNSQEILKSSSTEVALLRSEHQIALQKCETLDHIFNKEESRLHALQRVCHIMESRLQKMNQYHRFRESVFAALQKSLIKTASECGKLRESILRSSLQEPGRKVMTPLGLGIVKESRENDGKSCVFLPVLEATIHTSIEHLLLHEFKIVNEEEIAMRAEEDKTRSQVLLTAQREASARHCMQSEDLNVSKLILSRRQSGSATKLIVESVCETKWQHNYKSELDNRLKLGDIGSVSTSLVAQNTGRADERSGCIEQHDLYNFGPVSQKPTQKMFLTSMWFPSRSSVMLQRFAPIVSINDMQLLTRLNRLWEDRKKELREQYGAWHKERVTHQVSVLQCREYEMHLNEIAEQRQQQLQMLLEEKSCRRFYQWDKLRTAREQEDMALEESLMKLISTVEAKYTSTHSILRRQHGHSDGTADRRLQIKLEKKVRLHLQKLRAQMRQEDDSECKIQMVDNRSIEIPAQNDYDWSLITAEHAATKLIDESSLNLKIAKACYMQKLSQCELEWMRLSEHISSLVISLEYMKTEVDHHTLPLQRIAKKTRELAESLKNIRDRMQESNRRLAETKNKMEAAQELNQKASARFEYVKAQNTSMDSELLHGTNQRYGTRELLHSLQELYFTSLTDFLISHAVKEHHAHKMKSADDYLKHLTFERNCKTEKMKVLRSKHQRQDLMSLKRSQLPIFKISRRIALSNSFSRWKMYRSQSIRVRAIFDLKYQIILQNQTAQE